MSVCSGNLQQRKSGTREVEARDTTLTRILVSDLWVDGESDLYCIEDVESLILAS